MEKTRVRRFDFALFQDHQARSDRATVETQLHVHFYPDPGDVAHENIFARYCADHRFRLVLPGLAHRTHPVVAGGADLCRHLCQRHFNYDLRQQTILRRNLRVRHAPLAVADLTDVIPSEVEESRNEAETLRRGVLRLPCAPLRMTAFEKFCEIVARLRAPGGCPWDREQTHESLLPAMIEEAYEVTEAARAHNDAHFREELGDLLLLVVMHAEIAQESGRFNIDNVLQEISDKLVRRHPHVFGTSAARDSGAVLKQWEAIKREEKNADSHYLASLPKALPALMRAQKPQ